MIDKNDIKFKVYILSLVLPVLSETTVNITQYLHSPNQNIILIIDQSLMSKLKPN